MWGQNSDRGSVFLTISYSLTAPPDGWSGLRGRGSVEMAASALPKPTGDGSTMIFVCGTDGFVETWGGPVGRGPKKPDGSKGGKVQGPLLGLLRDVGFTESEVCSSTELFEPYVYVYSLEAKRIRYTRGKRKAPKRCSTLSAVNECSRLDISGK